MNTAALLNEVKYKATRSSGPGGQHVNKTSSRVELHWHTHNTIALTDQELARLQTKLKNRITKEGYIILASEKSRSQHKNKQNVTIRFLKLIEASLIIPKPKKKTKPSKASKLKRLDNKKAQSEKKANRKKPNY